MSRFMTVVIVVFAVAAAALLSVHIVSADALGTATSPILSSFHYSGAATPTVPGTPAGSDSGAAAPSNASGAIQQNAEAPQGQAGQADDSQDPQDQESAGTVTSIDSASHAFLLASTSGPISVLTTGQTAFEDGVTALGDLRPGMAVSLEGTQQSDGSFIASKVEGPTDSSENEESNVSSASSDND